MDIKRLAELACLELSPEEEHSLANDMKHICEMIDSLPELPETDLDRPETPLRQDIPVREYLRDEMLRNAPQTSSGYIVIPETVV